jgi:hypothetical protein
MTGYLVWSAMYGHKILTDIDKIDSIADNHKQYRKRVIQGNKHEIAKNNKTEF